MKFLQHFSRGAHAGKERCKQTGTAAARLKMLAMMICSGEGRSLDLPHTSIELAFFVPAFFHCNNIPSSILCVFSLQQFSSLNFMCSIQPQNSSSISVGQVWRLKNKFARPEEAVADGYGGGSGVGKGPGQLGGTE